MVAHYDEFLAEFQSARFTQYSLNELGRKSQNAEIENFATVEVFYDKDAFDEDVVLEAKRLVKPEEEGKKDGEKLTEEQIKVLKEHNIYDDAESLDIRFASKADREKEVEPKSPVSVRITIEKAALPEEASPDVVANYYNESIIHLEVEELRIVFLDTRQRPISDMVISVGTVNSSLVSVREILIESLKHLAVNVILLHNHPSGDPSPSKADIDITKDINKALDSIGIELIDHIVIGDNCYYSFKEQGII